MRKHIIGQSLEQAAPAGQRWVDVERLARVEITSEDPAYPIESALRPDSGPGWQAAGPGEQTIRLLFDDPLRLTRIRLLFHEQQQSRTHEFALRWSADGGQSYREIVRQQYTFSPPGTTREVEDYTFSLDGVTALEVRIIPDIGGGNIRASLAGLYIA
jgi:hypothetical protein